MAIQGVHSSNTYWHKIANRNNAANKNNIASGYRINKGADDAAGLAISEKLLRAAKGLDVGSSNVQDGISALNVADDALGSMSDSLQRIHELSLKASNGLYSDEDRGMIQKEISHLLDDVQGVAKNTQFNSMRLLDGSMADAHIASDADGRGMSIKMENTTLDTLGIRGYDVTSGRFDISAIDKAIEMVNSARSNMGVQTNRMEHTYNHNNNASFQQTSSYSSIKDLDMPKAISEQKKNKLMNQYQTMMLRRKMDDHRSFSAKIFE